MMVSQEITFRLDAKTGELDFCKTIGCLNNPAYPGRMPCAKCKRGTCPTLTEIAICLACTLPDCIYCLTDPPIELRRLCPIWLRDSAEQKRVQAAYMRRKRARAREERVSG